jgi:FkbM family methyltransferase
MPKLILEQIDTNRGKFLTISNDLYIPESLRKYGGWENEVYRECIKHLKPNSVIIEVGAHIGTHTIPFALYCPQGYIFAFEMQRFIHQMLSYNIIINGVKNVQTFQEAVTDEDSPFVTNDFRYDQEGINTGNTKIQFMDEMKQGFLPIYKCTLDKKFNHLNRLDLIKIDVECHEHFVIKGGLELIKRHKPIIMTEYHTVKTDHTNGNKHLIKELLPNYRWKELIGKYELNNKIIYNFNMIGTPNEME